MVPMRSKIAGLMTLASLAVSPIPTASAQSLEQLVATAKV
jgi:hypothetical protein